MCRSGTDDTIPTSNTTPSHVKPVELTLPGAKGIAALPPEPLHTIRGLARRTANWNSIAEHVAACMQEQLLDMIGLRYALCFVPLTHEAGVLHPLCPVCFLQRRGQQVIERCSGDSGQEMMQYRCHCCAEIFDIPPVATGDDGGDMNPAEASQTIL